MAHEIIQLKCNHCGQVFSAYKPEDNLHNTVYCPNCNNKITILLNPVDIQAEGQAQFPHLGPAQPVPGKTNLYYIEEHAIAGKRYAMRCGGCSRETVVAAQSGINKIKCKHCGAVTAFGADSPQNGQKQPQEKEKKPTEIIGGNGRMYEPAELIWGRLFSNKHYPLKPGTHYIGRRNVAEPSDIQLDDQFVSRRSVSIEVMPQGEGLTYKLVVLKATNPVLVNNVEILAGNSIYLNFGDTITMGKTRLTLRKAKK